MSLPLFLDIPENLQVAEIRQYLNNKGAEIQQEPSGHGLVAELSDIIRAAPVIWKEGTTEAEIESMMNGIISLLLFVPQEQAEPLIKSLCDSISATKATPARIKVLSNVFYGMDEKNKNRYYVYYTMIRMATQADLINHINPNLKDVKAWLVQWDVTLVQRQQLMRSLYEAYFGSRNTEAATRSMIELLGTYSAENAAQAHDDAHKCIVSCICDPTYYLLDHLLTLEPVKVLEGKLIHDLLIIFVSKTLRDFDDFYKANTEFCKSIGIKYEASQHKMRLLTFMSMAEKKMELDFESIMKELDMEEDDVLSFIIDVVATRAVGAKIDQTNRKVIVSHTTNRTFGRQQWQQLRNKLALWNSNLTTIMNSLQATTMPQAAMQ